MYWTNKISIIVLELHPINELELTYSFKIRSLLQKRNNQYEFSQYVKIISEQLEPNSNSLQ